MAYDKNLKTDRSIFIKNYLIENYSIKSKNEIIKELNLSWNYIQKMAHFFDIKRGFCDSPRTLIKLLDLNDNISCYWLGFLLADGHITKTYNFNVNLNTKDEKYFEQIENHLNIKLSPYYVYNLNSVRYTLSDKQTIKKISKIFNWKTNKTKNIPLIPKLDNNQLFSLIIGFIDGDGTISKKGNTIRIKCDKNWKNILEFFYKTLTDEEKKFNLTKDNCSCVYISKIKKIQEIKNKAIKLNLPIMNRKWNNINENKILKNDKQEIVKRMLLNNKNITEIKNETNFSLSLIYKTKKDIQRNLERY